MADERQEFSFSSNDFDILSTQEIDAENFLNSDPNEISVAKPKKTSPEESVEEKEASQKQSKSPKKPKIEEVEEEDRSVDEDSLFDSLNKKSEEADDKPDDNEVTDTTNSEEEGEEESNVYTVLAEELINLGIFMPDEDEEGNEVVPNINDAEEFAERFKISYRKGATETIEKFLSRFGDEYKEMFDSVFVKGVNPRDYLNRYTRIQSVKNLDISSEENQEKVVREMYRSEGRSADYIDNKITRLKNYGDLADEAAEAQRLLLEKEEKGLEEDTARKQAEIDRKNQIRNDYISNMNRILSDKLKNKDFNGIPVDRDFAQNTLEYVTQEKYQTPDKQLLTEFDKDILDLNRPENHERKVQLAMLLQMIKQDPTLSKMSKKAVSKETNELFKGLKKVAAKSSKKEEAKSTSKSWFE
jgi:hypothetical protein